MSNEAPLNSDRYIYHFTERETFEQARTQGQYKPLRFENDGFIHCSTREQVLDIANLIAPKDADLVLCEIDSRKVTPEIIYENLEGGDRLFPHVYGPLDLAAILKVWIFSPMNGEFIFPSDEALIKQATS